MCDDEPDPQEMGTKAAIEEYRHYMNIESSMLLAEFVSRATRDNLEVNYAMARAIEDRGDELEQTVNDDLL